MLLYQLFSFTRLLLVKSWSQFWEDTEQFLRYITPVICPHFMLRYLLIYFTTKFKYVKADHIFWIILLLSQQIPYFSDINRYSLAPEFEPHFTVFFGKLLYLFFPALCNRNNLPNHQYRSTNPNYTESSKVALR